MKFNILKKVNGSGSTAPKNKFAYIAHINDIQSFPKADYKGVALTDNIVMKNKTGMSQIYITPAAQEYTYDIVGDSDSKSFKLKFSGTHPGTELEALEFAKNYLEEGFVILIPSCEVGLKVLGTPDAPLVFTSSHKSDKDSQKFIFTFEQEIGTENVYQLYTGLVTLNANIEVDMGDFLEHLKDYIKIDGSNLSEAQKQNLRTILGADSKNLGNSDLSLNENRSFNLKSFFFNFFSNVGQAKIGINKNNPDHALDVVGNIRSNSIIIKDVESSDEIGTIKRVGNEIHFKTSLGWEMFMLKGDYVSDSNGVISPSTPVPVDGWKIGWYEPNSSSEDPGVNYPNCGDLKSIEGFFTKFYFNGSIWERVQRKIPTTKIETWIAQSYISGKQVFYNGNIYEAIQNTTLLDVPGKSEKFIEIIIGFSNYDYLLDINKGFVDKVLPSVPIIKTIHTSEAVFGGQFLETDNTVSVNGVYPFVGVIHNLDVTEAGFLIVENMFDFGISGKSGLLAVKDDDSIVSLLAYGAADYDGLKTFDLTGIKAVSLQVNSDDFANIQLSMYAYEPIDSKGYVDEKLKTLAYFLNTEAVEWTEIAMPQSGEVDNEAMGLGFSPIPGVGFAYGLIQNSSLNGYDLIKVEGSLSQFSGLWLWGQNNATGIYDEILKGVKYGSYIFNIDHTKYEAYGYTRFKAGTKFYKGKKVTKPIEEDAVKTYIDNHVSNGSSISNEIKATIKSPTKLVKVNFETNDALPVDKTVKANGVYNYDDGEGTVFKKFGTLEVQGSSSAQYPKKNWTFAFFNNEAKTSEFKLRIGKWVQHSEFVFKSNYIDATQSRNLVSNKIWEDIVQSRKTYPKRENEKVYVSSNGSVADRFDSGALCHVDGFPCELYVNGVFYGLGTFNLGKKRENYDLVSSNQNHIQIAAETHINFDSYTAAEWEIRNPKTPDSNFTTKINAWFASNALTGQSFKDAFPTNHDLRNAIEFFLLAEFIMAQDMFAKNFILTSWDGVKFAFMPYDMDTVFGLSWEGLNILPPTDTIRNIAFWGKFYAAYTPEIKARYAELKAADILTVTNVYKHFSSMAKIFGVEKYKEEFARWTQVPSNNLGVTNPYGSGGCYTSVSQIMDWTKSRLTWMDSQYS